MRDIAYSHSLVLSCLPKGEPTYRARQKREVRARRRRGTCTKAPKPDVFGRFGLGSSPFHHVVGALVFLLPRTCVLSLKFPLPFVLTAASLVISRSLNFTFHATCSAIPLPFLQAGYDELNVRPVISL